MIDSTEIEGAIWKRKEEEEVSEEEKREEAEEEGEVTFG